MVMEHSIVRSAILVIIQLLYFSLHLSCVSARGTENKIEMIPGGKQRVVNEGSFNITCRATVSTRKTKTHGQTLNITWSLPSIYSEDKQRSVLNYY